LRAFSSFSKLIENLTRITTFTIGNIVENMDEE